MIIQHEQGSFFVPLVSFYSKRKGKMKESKKEKKTQTVNVTYIVIISEYHMTQVLNNFFVSVFNGNLSPHTS